MLQFTIAAVRLFEVCLQELKAQTRAVYDVANALSDSTVRPVCALQSASIHFFLSWSNSGWSIRNRSESEGHETPPRAASTRTSSYCFKSEIKPLSLYTPLKRALPAPARKTAKRRAAPPQRPMPARASGSARHTATARSRKRPDRRDRWQKPLVAPNAPFLSEKRPCAKPRQAQKPPPARAKGARRAGSATGACHFSQSG